jgi:hypothetical protein
MSRLLLISSPLIVCRRGYAFRSARFDPQQYVPTEFERKWRGMPQSDRERLETTTFADLQRQDWRTLTKEQKRNSIYDPFPYVHVSLNVGRRRSSLHGHLWPATGG